MGLVMHAMYNRSKAREITVLVVCRARLPTALPAPVHHHRRPATATAVRPTKSSLSTGRRPSRAGGAETLRLNRGRGSRSLCAQGDGVPGADGALRRPVTACVLLSRRARGTRCSMLGSSSLYQTLLRSVARCERANAPQQCPVSLLAGGRRSKLTQGWHAKPLAAALAALG